MAAEYKTVSERRVNAWRQKTIYPEIGLHSVIEKQMNKKRKKQIHKEIISVANSVIIIITEILLRFYY